MPIGPMLLLVIISYLIILISQRVWSLLSLLVIFEIIWSVVCLYLSWYSIESVELGSLFWAITTLYFGAVELVIAIICILLYSDITGQSKMW